MQYERAILKCMAYIGNILLKPSEQTELVQIIAKVARRQDLQLSS